MSLETMPYSPKSASRGLCVDEVCGGEPTSGLGGAMADRTV